MRQLCSVPHLLPVRMFLSERTDVDTCQLGFYVYLSSHLTILLFLSEMYDELIRVETCLLCNKSDISGVNKTLYAGTILKMDLFLSKSSAIIIRSSL